MRIRDIMCRPVLAVSPDTPLFDAVELFGKRGFAALPVVDEDGRVAGILSQSDALRAATADAQKSVGTAMTVPVEVVAPTDSVADAARRMIGPGTPRSLPVVEMGLLVGIVARRDLLRSMFDDDMAIAAKIRALLDDYTGSRRQWAIAVKNGQARIGGLFADPAEQRTVRALARTVDGVRNVELQTSVTA